MPFCTWLRKDLVGCHCFLRKARRSIRPAGGEIAAFDLDGSNRNRWNLQLCRWSTVCRHMKKKVSFGPTIWLWWTRRTGTDSIWCFMLVLRWCFHVLKRYVFWVHMYSSDDWSQLYHVKPEFLLSICGNLPLVVYGRRKGTNTSWSRLRASSMFLLGSNLSIRLWPAGCLLE